MSIFKNALILITVAIAAYISCLPEEATPFSAEVAKEATPFSAKVATPFPYITQCQAVCGIDFKGTCCPTANPLHPIGCCQITNATCCYGYCCPQGFRCGPPEAPECRLY